jgi:beta-lactam-binding protein with PASTA domain
VAAVAAVVIAVLATRDDDGREAQAIVVPDVLGLEANEARQRVRAAGLEPEVERAPSGEPRGIVFDQQPAAGTGVAPRSAVVLAVSEGPPETTVTVTTTVTETQPTVTVPDVLGDDHVEAGAEIDALDLVADSFPAESDEARGTVVAQNPAGGTRVAEGTHVRLEVALGTGERPDATVPDVIGLPEDEARALVRESGFTVRTVDRDAPTAAERGEVLRQDPDPGTSAPVLTQIVLHVGR